MNRYQATEIEWETNEHDEVFLPTDIDIPDLVALDEFGNVDYDKIDKYLSGITGFLYDKYILEEIGKKETRSLVFRESIMWFKKYDRILSKLEKGYTIK